MAVTMQQVRAALSPDELDYTAAAAVGPEALPYLESLVRERDVLAAKAIYLASLIRDERSVALVREAASSREPTHRVASAAGTRNLSSTDAVPILEDLLTDHDPGVRKTALKSVAPPISDRLLPQIELIAQTDPILPIRDIARRVLARRG